MKQSRIESVLRKYYDDYIGMTAADVIYEQSKEISDKIVKDKLRLLNDIHRRLESDNLISKIKNCHCPICNSIEKLKGGK